MPDTYIPGEEYGLPPVPSTPPMELIIPDKPKKEEEEPPRPATPPMEEIIGGVDVPGEEYGLPVPEPEKEYTIGVSERMLEAAQRQLEEARALGDASAIAKAERAVERRFGHLEIRKRVEYKRTATPAERRRARLEALGEIEGLIRKGSWKRAEELAIEMKDIATLEKISRLHGLSARGLKALRRLRKEGVEPIEKLSVFEAKKQRDTLRAQADAIQAQRGEIIGGFGRGWSERYDRLSTKDKEKYDRLMSQEEHLRSQTSLLHSYLMARGKQAKIPEDVRVSAADIVRGTTLPVKYTATGVFYDIEKIIARPALMGRFLEKHPELRGDIEGYLAATEASTTLKDYISVDPKTGKSTVDILGAAVGDIPYATLTALGVTGLTKSGYESLGKLKDYRGPGGYYIASAIAFGGLSAEALKGIFSEEAIKGAQLEAEGLLAKRAEVAEPVVEELSAFEKWFTSPLAVRPAEPKGLEKLIWGPSPLFLTKERELKSPAAILGAKELQIVALGLGVAAATPAGIIYAARYVPWVSRLAPLFSKKTLEVGGIVTATTGVGALVTGAILPSPEIKVEVYESVDLGKIGTAKSFTTIAGYVDPTTGKIDTGRMVGELGEAGTAAALAQAGYTPEIPREAYEQLSPDMQEVYTPSARRALAYEPGIAGAYGRGVEFLYQPIVRGIQEKVGGLPGQLGAGMFQYMVPHTLVTELYREKGGLAALTLIPHFGPTAAYTGLTWERQPWYGKVAGIGFAILPFAIGPAGTVVGGVYKAVSKIPVLGPTLRGITWAPRQVLQLAGEAGRFARLEQWAPWRAAYQVSGLAGRAGLARIPGLGPMGARWGWWPGGEVPVGLWKARPRILTPEEIEFRAKATALREYGRPTETITLERALKGPEPLAGRALEEALYGPQRVGPKPYIWPGGEPSAYAFPGYELGAKPAIVQQVSMPSYFTQFTQFARQIMPRVTTAGVYAAPMLGAAFLPMMAPTIDVSVLAKTDIATVDQMLREKTITQVQHDKIVSQIQTIQEIAVTQEQYQQQAQDVIQEHLTQQQVQQQQEIVQEQTQQELVQQQEVLQEMQQRKVTPWQILQQQQIIRQLRQELVQPQLMTFPEQAPPSPQRPFWPIIFPLIPFLPGAPRRGAGLARGFRAGRLGYEQVMWPFPEMVISFPDPWTLQRKEYRIRKKGKLPFGGRIPKAGLLTRTGMRL